MEDGEPVPKLDFPPLSFPDSDIYLYYFPTPRAPRPLPCRLNECTISAKCSAPWINSKDEVYMWFLSKHKRTLLYLELVIIMTCVATCFDTSNVAHRPVFKRKLIAVDQGNDVVMTGTSLQSSTQDQGVTLLPCNKRKQAQQLWPYVMKSVLYIDSSCMPTERWLCHIPVLLPHPKSIMSPTLPSQWMHYYSAPWVNGKDEVCMWFLSKCAH